MSINRKRLIIGFIVLQILLLPVLLFAAKKQQETRSRASESDRKIFLGMATDTSQRFIAQESDSGKALNLVINDLENIKNQTGSYPAVYHFFGELGGFAIPSLEILNYLDSKVITPAISLAPLGPDARRRDGRFIFSSNINPIDSASTGQLRFNNTSPSQITKIYVSKTARGTENPKNLADTWIPGAKISLFGETTKTNDKGEPYPVVAYGNSNYFDFTVNSKTETPLYWEVNIRVTKPGSISGIISDGKPVFITMADTFGKNWGNSKIARGSQDDKFTKFALIAKEFGKPIILRYAWEMDGDWFPWSEGKRNAVSSYGRYTYFDMGNTKSNYVDAWRHIHQVIRPIAPNLKFYWCSGGSPLASYFPGDNYVDYVGFDTYSGIQDSQHKDLINLSRNPINALTALSSKEIIIGETGINASRKQISESQFPTYRKNWILEGYRALYNYSPRVAGIIYFNVDARYAEKRNNWLISYDPEVSSSYRQLLMSPKFQGRLVKRAILTPTPTRKPTLTLTPTKKITPNPTKKLTLTPTKKPTAKPTQKPTPKPATPTPSRIPTGTPTPTPAPNTTIFHFANAKLHGIGNGGDNTNPNLPGNMNPITLTRVLNVEILNVSGTVVSTSQGNIVYSSANGSFTGDVKLDSSLTSGSYLVKVNSPKYLKKQLAGIITINKGTFNQMPEVSLITGDSNLDGTLSILDYNIIIDCYSDLLPAKNCSDLAKKANADLSDDGKVDQDDYNLLLRELSVKSGD